MFSKVTLGNVEACRTEAEISDETGNCLAIVYELRDGWHVEPFSEIRPHQIDDFVAIVERAKNDLRHYVNRIGLNAPEDLSAEGLSLWLMQKDDGTALGIRFADAGSENS